MDSESFVAENAPPLIPPPLLEPIPPPVVYRENRSPLWRHNDRLALVAGGLTLILLGVIGGRAMGPRRANEGSGEPLAMVEPFQEQALPLEISSYTSVLGEVSSEEINPPELVVTAVSIQPAVEVTEQVPAARLATVPQPAAVPSKVPQAETATSEVAEESAKVANLPAAVAKFPVSVEGLVSTIKVPATTQVCALEENSTDRKLNTALTWAKSVSEANQRADEEDKLVFLIHVSGNFEMPGFT